MVFEEVFRLALLLVAAFALLASAARIQPFVVQSRSVALFDIPGVWSVECGVLE